MMLKVSSALISNGGFKRNRIIFLNITEFMQDDINKGDCSRFRAHDADSHSRFRLRYH